MVLAAITREVSPTIGECALSFIPRQRIDPDAAAEQHRAYEDLLRRLGVEVCSLPAQPELPDAVFVEDTAVVVPEVAVMTIPLLPSRQQEVESVEAVLRSHRPIHRLTGDARLEGGDVLRIGRILYVGLSRRTNREGIAQLGRLLEPHGYVVKAVPFEGCLHLKTACTYIGKDAFGNATVLAHRAWVDARRIQGMQVIDVPPTEAEAGNALLVGDIVVMPDSFPETRAALEARGFTVELVDVSELQKAEAGVTCCSILLELEAGQDPA